MVGTLTELVEMKELELLRVQALFEGHQVGK